MMAPKVVKDNSNNNNNNIATSNHHLHLHPQQQQQHPQQQQQQQHLTNNSNHVDLGDELIVKSTDLLFMRDNFISGLSHLESGVHALKRAYITQFNTLLPEGHLGRLQLPYYPPTLPMDPAATSLQPPAPLMQPAIAVPPPDTAAATNNGNSKKRSRKPHDPNHPKRALTSYFLFMQNNKPAIKLEHPDWDAKQISEESERRWNNISDKERADYEYLYQVDLARYYHQKDCYSRGEAVPDVSHEEAKDLYREHLKTGIPFKGRKGPKTPRAINIPSEGMGGAGMLVDEEDDSDDSDEMTMAAAIPKMKRPKAGMPSKSLKGRV